MLTVTANSSQVIAYFDLVHQVSHRTKHPDQLGASMQTLYKLDNLGGPLTVIRSLVVTAASQNMWHAECYSCDRSSTHISKVSQHT